MKFQTNSRNPLRMDLLYVYYIYYIYHLFIYYTYIIYIYIYIISYLSYLLFKFIIHISYVNFYSVEILRYFTLAHKFARRDFCYLFLVTNNFFFRAIGSLP